MGGVKAIRRFSVRTALPEPIAALGDLAMNLRWSWHSPTRELFAGLDPQRWDEVHQDPVRLLSTFSNAELEELATDGDLVARVGEAKANLDRYLTSQRWYQEASVPEERGTSLEGGSLPSSIAYFSPEYGITAVLPQYSGGLGILAGDHLKAASDLGVPIVGVGLFYKTGYFKQSLDQAGWQQETYPVLDPQGLPLHLLREDDGTPCVITVAMPGGASLRAHVWRAQVGRVPLLLLDSDVPGNDDAMRAVTERLYGGGGEQRLQQEMLLGIGGVRALRLWSRLTGAPEPEVFHTNEGHAGFLGIERISEFTQSAGMGFEEAMEAARAGTVFTTHTPVPAGIDRFDVGLLERYFGGPQELPGVPLDKLRELGAETYEGGSEGVFNMAVMGLRLAERANGVSQLHGVVSRGMFDGLWPGFDDDEVPITSITNGVHAPTWVDDAVYDIAAQHLGGRDVEASDRWDAIPDVPGEAIWQAKAQMRARLVQDVRNRLRASWAKRGATDAELGWTEGVLDPEVLTIGFARRVPTYKRLTLMLRDPERLKALLLHPERPVQLVIAGKSHPADDTGKQLIQQMVQFADQHDVRHRIVFLPNYDIAMARTLYPGCDVWLNNPLRPFEACGTSGMKAALNGGLNLSILDGWWDEWYDGGNGWAIPTADGVADEARRDDIEAAALYDLIETEVAPRFYDVDDAGLPQRWLSMLRHTLTTLGPKVLATRMVRDYTEQLYAPAAAHNARVNADDHAGAKALADYKARARAGWSSVHVDHVEGSGVSDSPLVGESLHVDAYVALDGLAPDEVDVQVVAGRVALGTDDLVEWDATSLSLVEGYEDGKAKFSGDVPIERPGQFGWTVRVLPRHELMAFPASLGLVANA
ncbi:alpha-glucan family phosphorylase [Janibacter anophelis]